MRIPCGHEATRPGCHLCHLAETVEAYARLWRGVAPHGCTRLGLPLTDDEKADRDLYQLRDWRWCRHTDRVRLGIGEAVCSCTGCGVNCRGYDDGTPKPPAAPARRHCLMHVLPVAGNGVWQRSLAQVAARWGLFTGRVVLAVCTGEARGKPLDPPAAVRRVAPWADVIEVPNDPARREVATWGPLWDRLAPHLGAADSVLYCHTKGATRSVDPGNSCHWWGSLMWSVVLDHWPLVESQLKAHPVTGPFLKVGYGFGRHAGRFHYSGTFFWTRAADFLARRRKVLPPGEWWGVEAWPGVAYDVAEAGCLFHRGKVPGLDLYNRGYWSGTVMREYQTWLRANPPAWPWLTAKALSGGGVSTRR